jgi:hypothetical protein
VILLLLACGLDQIAPPDRPNRTEDTGCGVDWGWDIVDSTGSCTACIAGEYFTFQGSATNTCAEEEFFKTSNSCLIDSVVVKERGSGTTVFQVSGECVPEDQTWALNPAETIAEELDAPQPLGAGEYILEVLFGDADGSVAGAPFSVQ